MNGSVQGEAYLHPAEHLADELHRLDVLIEAGFQSMTAQGSDDPALDPFRGLVVTESEARSLLEDGDRFTRLSNEQAAQLDNWERHIALRVEATLEQGVFLPLAYLQRIYQLSDWELRALVAVAAPEVHRKYEKLYAFLQDDMTSKFATADLILRLCCQSEQERQEMLPNISGPAGKLRAFLHREPAADGVLRTSISRPLRLDERMLAYIQGYSWQFEGVLAGLRLLQPDEALPALRTGEEQQARLASHMAAISGRSAAGTALYMLWGPEGSGKTLQARHACAKLGKPLLEWDVSAGPEELTDFEDAFNQVLREAKLQDAVPAFDRVHALSGSADSKDRRAAWMLARLEAWRNPVFLFGETALTPSGSNEDTIWIDFRLDVPEPAIRQQLWLDASGEQFPLTGGEAGSLAAKFRFTPGRIASTVTAARQMRDWERVASDGQPNVKWLHRAAYKQVQHRMSEKAVRMEPKFEWDDLILPDETKRLLRQACNRLTYRHIVFGEWGFERKLAYGKGTSMLFTGPPGTGKTMSALVMAKEMDAELYRIDLSRIVSKYIGETEKNLHEIFEEAQRSGAILFFDEADALFGKRSEVKDAQDKYANMETSYLLQKMEEYDGLTILATNFAQNLDEAFNRRIGFIVKFPFPDPAQRELLWRATFPKDMPMEENIDFTYLANTFDLSGGPIKNIVLTAAFLAAEEEAVIGMRHLMEAAKQEYRKTGKVLLKDRLGAYA